MKLLICLISFLMCFSATAKTLRVAVIDTGLDLTDPRFKGYLCKDGHKSFAGPLDDTHGHGTHVAGLIVKNAGPGDYCLMIYKYYDERSTGQQNLDNEIKAIESAVSAGADIINYSGGGPTFNETEYLAIRTHPGTTFVVAAGNEGQNLDVPGNEYYPASYFLKNEIVVGNFDNNESRVPSSNWGSKVVFETGYHQKSFLPNNREGLMTGTSQATAVYTGKLVRKLLHAKTVGR